MDFNIEFVKTSELKPYERNAKKHPADQVEHIANSIKEFGFRQPIVADRNNIVVIGHGRLLASQKLGLEVVPVVYVDDLTEEQIKALRLSDNKTNESEYDFDILDQELADILDLDMSDFGFDLNEFEEYTGEGAKEYSEEDFSDEKFKCECPKCGFKFNP